MNGNHPHNSFKVLPKGVLENYFEVHSPNRARTSRPEHPPAGVASAWAMASSSAARRRGSSSLHSLRVCGRPSCSTNACHDFTARWRSSSGVSFSNSASICARLILDSHYARPFGKASCGPRAKVQGAKSEGMGIYDSRLTISDFLFQLSKFQCFPGSGFYGLRQRIFCDSGGPRTTDQGTEAASGGGAHQVSRIPKPGSTDS